MTGPNAEQEHSEIHAEARQGALPHDDFTPVFRAVSTPRQRRGIRLEAIYWAGLKMIADASHTSLGATVENAAESAPDSANLASLLRVRVARWLSERVVALEAMTRLEALGPLVHASPVPTFVITLDKRIALFNRALLTMVQTRFPNSRPDIIYKGLRLSLDTHVEQVVARLTQGDAAMVTTGFAIGIEGQRLRGTVNCVLAPTHRQAAVIAFVVGVAENGGEPSR